MKKIETTHNKTAKKRANQRRIDFDLTVLALPGILLLLIFNYLPMGGLLIAFKNYTYSKGILGSDWAGLENFKFFFTSQDAWRVTRNTVGYGVLFILLGIASGVILALMLYEIRSKLALKIYQTSMILPSFLSWVIIGYITYIFLNVNEGVINKFLTFVGIAPKDWYNDPKYWPFILSVVRVWQSVGMGSLVYYAALMGIDTEIFEAAQIDGTNKLQQILYISIPELSPVICIMLIMNMGSVIKGDFGLFYQIPRDIGVLYPTTDIIDTYVFRGVRNANFSMSSAVGFFQSFVGLVLVVITNHIVTKIEPDNAMF